MTRMAAGFDVVLAEAMDRLSRDQEDVAAVYKRLMAALALCFGAKSCCF